MDNVFNFNSNLLQPKIFLMWLNTQGRWFFNLHLDLSVVKLVVNLQTADRRSAGSNICHCRLSHMLSVIYEFALLILSCRHRDTTWTYSLICLHACGPGTLLIHTAVIADVNHLWSLKWPVHGHSLIFKLSRLKINVTDTEPLKWREKRL